MKFLKFFKEFNLPGDVPMLVWLENDGDHSILHLVVWPEEIGTADIKLSGPAEAMEKMYAALDADKAKAVFDQYLGGFIEALEADDGKGV